MACWQRGNEKGTGLDGLQLSKKKTLDVPQILQDVLPAKIIEGKSSPKSTEKTVLKVFEAPTSDDQNMLWQRI